MVIFGQYVAEKEQNDAILPSRGARKPPKNLKNAWNEAKTKKTLLLFMHDLKILDYRWTG